MSVLTSDPSDENPSIRKKLERRLLRGVANLREHQKKGKTQSVRMHTNQGGAEEKAIGEVPKPKKKAQSEQKRSSEK